jgi:trans-aconitate 2-methyltransferase
MAEWDALAYAQRSGLQRAMAEEVLALLDLRGSERILDVGCGNGKTTAEIAARVPYGEVLGVDASHTMIRFAQDHFGPDVQPNLRFQVAVSLNALHWIPEQDEALQSIWAALKPAAWAQLRLVPAGPRKSLENVIEETRRSERWIPYFQEFQDPYLHFTPEQYTAAAERAGFHICRLHVADKAWDFESRPAFHAFSSVMLAEWLRFVPENQKPEFVTDILNRYRSVANEKPGDENTFKFYQMDLTLAKLPHH